MTRVPSGFRTSGKRSSLGVLAIPAILPWRPKKRTGLGSPPRVSDHEKCPAIAENRDYHVRSSGLIEKLLAAQRALLGLEHPLMAAPQRQRTVAVRAAETEAAVQG